MLKLFDLLRKSAKELTWAALPRSVLSCLVRADFLVKMEITALSYVALRLGKIRVSRFVLVVILACAFIAGRHAVVLPYLNGEILKCIYPRSSRCGSGDCGPSSPFWSPRRLIHCCSNRKNHYMFVGSNWMVRFCISSWHTNVRWPPWRLVTIKYRFDFNYGLSW